VKFSQVNAMTETFYKLTHEEWKQMMKLRPAESKVLLYLRTLAPFGDRPISLTVRGVARETELAPGTVSKALKELDRLGWIDLELLKVSIKVNPFSPSKEVFPSGNSRDVQETPVTSRKQLNPVGNSCSPEPSPSKGFASPQTNKTNKTNKKRERAIEISNFLESNSSFRNFCLRKAQGLPSVPVLLDSWIVANFEELKKMWAKSQTSSGDQNSAAARQNSVTTPAVVETERSRSVVKYPQVQARIDRGELKQDPIFPEGVYDLADNWWKKADLEELSHEY
jgi:hypothetical protein